MYSETGYMLMRKKAGSNYAKWFTEEIPELLQNGIVDEQTASRLRGYYEDRVKPEKQSYSLLALVILGALLVSGGVVLLFAHNWDMLAKWQRVAAAFIPVVIGTASGVWTIVKEKDARWREFSAFFTAAAFAVLIALISQIYHTGGTLEEYIRLVLLLCLPLIYIFGSQTLAIVYSFGLFSFYDFYRMDDTIHLLYLAAIVPFYVWFLFRKPQDGATVWARYAVLVPIANLLFAFDNDSVVMNGIAINAMLFTAGLVYRDQGERGWKNPWLIFGWIFFTLLLSIGSASRYFWREVELARMAFGFWVIPLAAGLFFAIRRFTPVKLMVMAFPLIALFSYWEILDRETMFWLSNAYFALFALTMLIHGIRNKALMEINGGMLQLALLFSFRFFDSRIGIIERAVAFIVIGLFFIAMNVYLSRKFKREARKESEAADNA